MINVGITSLGGTYLKPLLLIKSCLASLDSLCHRFHCCSPTHQEYLFSPGADAWLLLLSVLNSPLYRWGLIFIHRFGWSVSQLLGLCNDRFLEETVFVLPGHSWRQLPLQHILHGVCLKSNDLAVKKRFQISFLLLLAFILLLFQTYQNKHVSNLCFH